MPKAIFYLLLAACASFAGCSQRIGPVPVQASTEPFTQYRNIVYGTDSIQQSMDVTLPPNGDKRTTPVVILIHGGSWVVGAKNDFYGLGLDTFFAANGCALININYRLDQYYPYPAAVEDLGLVMAYLKNKANAWKINPNKVCIFGRSSGAHLALLYAYAHNQDNRIKAVIDGFGPVNFIDSSIIYTELGLNVTYMLGAYNSHTQQWHDASPIFYMAGAVPTVIYQGTADSLVYPIQSQMLQDSLMARGVPSLYFQWVGNRHGWSQDRWLQSRDATMAWIKHFL
jgi:acetyl esterase/lipase